MGFSLEQFFKDLFEVLDSDEKVHKKLMKLTKLINSARQSADYLIKAGK